MSTFIDIFLELCSDDEEEMEADEIEFGDGSIFNDFDRPNDSLIPIHDITNLVTEVEEESQDLAEYDPLQAITKEDEQALLKTAVELEPHHHEINHKLQINQGPTSSDPYLKSVMLMIISDLRVLHLTPSQEMNLRVLAERKSPEPNAALDAWILLNGLRRTEFNVKILLDRYPGLKLHIKCNEDEIDGDEKDNEEDVSDNEDENSDESDKDDMNNGKNNEGQDQEVVDEDDMSDGKISEDHGVDDDDDEDLESNDEETPNTVHQTTTKGKPWLVKFTSWWHK